MVFSDQWFCQDTQDTGSCEMSGISGILIAVHNGNQESLKALNREGQVRSGAEFLRVPG